MEVEAGDEEVDEDGGEEVDFEEEAEYVRSSEGGVDATVCVSDVCIDPWEERARQVRGGEGGGSACWHEPLHGCIRSMAVHLLPAEGCKSGSSMLRCPPWRCLLRCANMARHPFPSVLVNEDHTCPCSSHLMLKSSAVTPGVCAHIRSCTCTCTCAYVCAFSCASACMCACAHACTFTRSDGCVVSTCACVSAIVLARGWVGGWAVRTLAFPHALPPRAWQVERRRQRRLKERVESAAELKRQAEQGGGSSVTVTKVSVRGRKLPLKASE